MATVSGGGGGDGYGSLPGITDSAPHATLQASTADSYQLHAADAELESGPYASLVASEVTQSSPAKSTSTHSAPGQSRSSSGATSGDRGKGGVCPGFGGADGNLRFILMVILVLEFLFGNWANDEPVIHVGADGSSPGYDQRASWAGMPSSYNFSLYFILCLGILTVLTRLSATGFMLAFFTLVSVIQDWVLFAIYWNAMNSSLLGSGSIRNKSLVRFMQFSLIAAHLVKIAIVVFGMWIFSRRGGNLSIPLRALPYQRMRGRNNEAPLY